MQLGQNDIHVFAASLTETVPDNWSATLSADECARAARLRSPLHQKRFIAAHIMLREILALYLHAATSSLQFQFNSHHKPFLAGANAGALQFNLSHSEDMAICAVTRIGEIGIDIEAIGPENKNDVAERFFSAAEKASLSALPPAEQVIGFYRIWARKEAIIKAIGKGLSHPLSSFSVAVTDEPETLQVEGHDLSLYPLVIHPGFAAAVAVNGRRAKITVWDYRNHQAIQRPS